ncbi:unnamed protein product [Rhizoctonia solani]|uniref:FAS1 domain-containing protein n=1 Tax=Rhizoctonia solani TaxID=456999 RepID=A0A8H3AAM0_9AGAM|nr:unnamed protein product [Rhizoctonia solani]
MRFLARVVPTFFAVSGLVQALAIAPRDNHDFFSGFLDTLYEHGLTTLADSYKKISRTNEGKQIIKQLESGEFTVLAPENKAFGSYHTTIEPDVIRYSTLFGKFDNGCDTGSHSRRAATFQSRSTSPSTFRRSSAPSRKRAEPFEDYQVQIVDRYYDSSTNEHSVVIDRPVGNAKIGDKFCYKNLVILTTDTILTTPPLVSELLSQPLTESAPNGFSKFLDALQRTQLADTMDNKDRLTSFVPLDESLNGWDEYSNEELKLMVENHIFFGQVLFSNRFTSAGEVTAQSGERLKLSVEDGTSYVSCGTSKVKMLRTDVTSSNGVVHVTDGPIQCN